MATRLKVNNRLVVAIAAVSGAAALLIVPPSARANDTLAVMPAGGLTFAKSDAIEMRSEDLRVSRDAIEVHYEFFNTSGSDVTSDVAFPLPEVKPYAGVPEQQAAGLPADNFVGFTVLVDGRPLTPTLHQQAFVKGREVTPLLREAGLPINYFNVTEANSGKRFDQLVENLPQAARDRLRTAGVLGPGEGGDFDQKYTVRSSFVWTQTFPAGRTLKVAHRYVPVAGGNWFGPSDAKDLKSANAGTYKGYCIDQTTLGGLRKMLAGDKRSADAGGPMLQSWLIGYVLTTGANWKGPIGRFRLTVEKPGADSILSTCFDGLRKVDATRFVFKAENFTPRADLKFAFFYPMSDGPNGGRSRNGEVRPPSP